MNARHTHVIAIVGGAVSGSEAAAIAAERGALVVVIDQNARPYGKIEDGLPCWHVALRHKEYARIDDNLAHPDVRFVPLTRLGRDVDWTTLTRTLGFSAVVLANGAWRDRPLPPEIDAFSGRGLVYQNAFVHAFNHQHDPGPPALDIPDGAIVIGGGLASIDCVKIINFVLYQRALAARGVEVDLETLEQEGLPSVLGAHGLTREALGLAGATLYYRRRAEDMPLVSADDADAARVARLEQTRVKLLTKVLDKYLVRFVPLAAPVAPLVEHDRLVGVRFRKNTHVDGKLVATDEHLDVPTPLVVSSIGSIPELIDGIPSRGELYLWRDRETGELADDAEVYGLGNVLTGKGNIVESRKSSRKVMSRVVAVRLGLRAPTDADVDAAHAGAREAAREVVDAAMQVPPIDTASRARIDAWIEQRWGEVGYEGDYRTWMARHAPEPGGASRG